MKKVEMSLEVARQLYKEKPELRVWLLENFTKSELKNDLKTWEELGKISGYCISSVGNGIVEVQDNLTTEVTKMIYATEKQARSALAYAQLTQLMKDLGEECNVDWYDDYRYKYCIVFNCPSKQLEVSSWAIYAFIFHFLAFRTREVAEKFMRKHEKLIKEYFMVD